MVFRHGIMELRLTAYQQSWKSCPLSMTWIVKSSRISCPVVTVLMYQTTKCALFSFLTRGSWDQFLSKERCFHIELLELPVFPHTMHHKCYVVFIVGASRSKWACSAQSFLSHFVRRPQPHALLIAYPFQQFQLELSPFLRCLNPSIANPLSGTRLLSQP